MTPLPGLEIYLQPQPRVTLNFDLLTPKVETINFGNQVKGQGHTKLK